MTEVTLGILPGACGTQNLPRAVGVRRAKELILTGTPFTARAGLRMGHGQQGLRRRPADERGAWPRRAASPSNAPISVRQAKKAIDKATDLDRTTGYAFEIEAYNRTVGTEDRQEGINAFNEKRKPKYKGR